MKRWGSRLRLWLRVAAASMAFAACGVLVAPSPAAAAPVLFFIKNRQSNACLTMNPGNSILMQSCGSSTRQMWYTVLNSDGRTYAIKNYAYGNCVNTNAATGAVTVSCSGNTSRWYSVAAGDYDIIKNYVTARSLAVNASGSLTTVTTSGANAQWDWIIA